MLNNIFHEENKKNINIKFIIIVILLLFSYFPYKYNYNNELALDYPELLIDIYKTYFSLLNKKHTFDLFRKQNKIENIFILIIIFPFLKNKIIITKKNSIYNLCKNLFNIQNDKKIIIIKDLLNSFSQKFNELLFYNWEFLPNKNKTNYLRYIINHYYSKECLNIFEKSLNLNIRNYIDYHKERLSYEIIVDLMSKIISI